MRVCGRFLLYLGAITLIVFLLLLLNWGSWKVHLAEQLVCQEERLPSAALLIENVDTNYFIFEEAARLQYQGLGDRAIVPVKAKRDANVPSPVAGGFVEVMARVAYLEKVEMVPIREMEPISLNMALQIRGFLKEEGILSVLLVSGGFRSRRSHLVYRSVLGEAGIQVYCVPVFGLTTPVNWTESWHGIQAVMLQWIKLLYYRLAVI